MKLFVSVIALVAAATLGNSCQVDHTRKVATAEELAFAERLVDALRYRHFQEIESEVDPSIANRELRTTLLTMADMFPSPTEDPGFIKAVGGNTLGRNTDEVRITLEYQFHQKWLLADVNLRATSMGGFVISGFHVRPIPDSVERMRRFTLIGKTMPQYGVLLLALAGGSICSYAFRLCIRTTTGKVRWVWLAVILLGVGKLGINWTTGETSISPLALQFPAVQAFPHTYGPWLLEVSLPLGAIIFVVRRQAGT
jgi:hypothetical protein